MGSKLDPRRLTIRPERPEDREAIHEVQVAAFGQPAEARLVDLLRAGGKVTVSLVAEVDGRIAGHVLFSPVMLATSSGTLTGQGLAPVGVLPALQNWDIGRALVEAGLAACEALGVPFVVLVGDPAYYSRFGFERASRLGLTNDYGVDEEFQVRELRPGGLPESGGHVSYAPEFASVEE